MTVAWDRCSDDDLDAEPETVEVSKPPRASGIGVAAWAVAFTLCWVSMLILSAFKTDPDHFIAALNAIFGGA